MERLKLAPDDVWSLKHEIEKEIFRAISNLQTRAEQAVSDLKKGDKTISRENVFTDWAKEFCAQMSIYVAEEKLVWVAKGRQPQNSPRAQMSQVQEVS